MRIFCVLLALFINPLAHADGTIYCEHLLPHGGKEKVSVTFFSEGDFVKITFPGPSSDRFFSRTDRQHYVQFGTKNGSQDRVELAPKMDSILTHPTTAGGASLIWEENSARVMDCHWSVNPWSGEPLATQIK